MNSGTGKDVIFDEQDLLRVENKAVRAQLRMLKENRMLENQIAKIAFQKGFELGGSSACLKAIMANALDSVNEMEIDSTVGNTAAIGGVDTRITEVVGGVGTGELLHALSKKGASGEEEEKIDDIVENEDLALNLGQGVQLAVTSVPKQSETVVVLPTEDRMLLFTGAMSIDQGIHVGDDSLEIENVKEDKSALGIECATAAAKGPLDVKPIKAQLPRDGLKVYCKSMPSAKNSRAAKEGPFSSPLISHFFPFSRYTDLEICQMFEEWDISLGVINKKRVPFVHNLRKMEYHKMCKFVEGISQFLKAHNSKLSDDNISRDLAGFNEDL